MTRETNKHATPRGLERAVLAFAMPLALLPACSRDRGRSARGLVYVSDEGSAVVVIDPASTAVVGTINVGKRPRGLKISRDGARLYVALSGSPRAGPGIDEAHLPPPDHGLDGVGIIDLAARKLIATLPGGDDPETFDLSPDGQTLYVSNEDSAELTALDVASGAIRGTVAVGKEPEGVAVRPDGKIVFVTSEQASEVTAVDTATLAVVAHVPAGPRPRSIVITKDGATAFVTDEMGAKLTVVDAVAFKAIGDIALHGDAPAPSVPRPMGAVLSPDGKEVYVTCGRSGSVAVVDVATRAQVRSIDTVGDRPWGVGVSPDGAHLYTANGPSADVSIIALATGNVERRIHTGGAPWGIAVAP